MENVKCLRFNSAQSCLLLPGIPGMRLRSIKIQVVTTAGYKPMSIATTKWSDAANVVPRTDFNAGELTSASAIAGADVPLYLYTYSKTSQIARIELYFE